jgi:DNA invertase Pin-like site-specific DNA recombinase
LLQVAIIWLSVVVGGCRVSSGNVFSTNSTHFAQHFRAQVIQRSPRWSVNTLIRFWAVAAIGVVGVAGVNAGTHRGRSIKRVCIYARYSTEEQDESSIPDQFAYCRRYLDSIGLNPDELQIVEQSDAEISGEVVNRPGIDRVAAGIEHQAWDLLICEDSSRLFRNVVACVGMVGEAFDQGIRTIAINDDVDTNEEDWEDRLEEAATHHARTNRYTSKRIKRKLASLWRLNAAIGKLRPGYRRIRPDEETMQVGRRIRRRPKFDEIDPETAAVVMQAYERIATGEPAESVARWLTEIRFRKAGRNASTEWMAKDVNTLIRRTIYRGHDVYRAKTAERTRRTGHRYSVANEPEKVLTREMPHLRIVADELWYQANAVIDARITRENVARGEQSPLFRRRRSSANPLANILQCVCGQKMWTSGRQGKCYKCRGACRNQCWNRATITFAIAHAKLSVAITDELFRIVSGIDVLSEYIGQRLASDEEREERLRHHRAAARSCTAAIQRLEAAIEQSDEDVASLLQRRHVRQQELLREEASIRHIENEQGAQHEISPDAIRNRIMSIRERLINLDPQVNGLLRHLIPNGIVAVPYQRIDCGLVVLRAEFELSLAALLPEQLTLALGGQCLDACGRIATRSLVVDLFESPPFVQHATYAAKLKEDQKGYVEIAHELQVAKRQAVLAVKLGRQMAAAGLTEPFVRLESAPANASRWR